MMETDITKWKKFVIGDLFEKLDLKVIKSDFNKALDVSEIRSEEFNIPLVNAKHGNNGIMFYGRDSDFETAEMTIDIVQNGAIATGDVYAQPQKTGVLWDAYLIKPKVDIKSVSVLQFLATVLEKAIKDKFSYDDKCVWDKAKLLSVPLPVTLSGEPNWNYMGEYMSRIEHEVADRLALFRQTDSKTRNIEIFGWKEFVVGELFRNIVKPPVLHSRQIVETEDGVPYVVRTKFDNGIKCRVKPVACVEPSPAGVISWGAENATFFYQEEPFLSGRDIYYIDTTDLKPMTCRFLTACLQKIASKYPYNYGLFPDLLKEERIKLPVTLSGEPDWNYMEKYMTLVTADAESNLNAFEQLV
ncbi:MAG: hypothetical protein LUC25_04220 [Ruminococcus sp.]|nr:hypothetical protein [Ruminococcus sp.]